MARLINPGYLQGLQNRNENIEKAKIKVKPQVNASKSFHEYLESEKKLKFSAHAQKRIESRNIEILPDELEKIEAGVAKLRKKGCRDSIILSQDKAYVVSVKNNTVVTIVDEANLKENIFTNIDSMTML
jgi:flagellar operon protein